MTDKSYSTYQDLFLRATPLLDVRSPSEFSGGSFPSATNIPILDDQERHLVGLCYAQKGSTAAFSLGQQLVSNEIKQRRVTAWKEFAQKNPTGALFCWRGGERSRIAQEWLRDAGVEYPRIEGGFKALRKFLMETMEDLISKTEWIVMAGPTGSGKTERLQEIENAIDLEGLANHRGSAFGGNATPQPSQIDFEHRLAITLLNLHKKGITKIYVEDESRMIGKSALPVSLYKKILTSPLVLVDEPIEKRTQRIIQQYICHTAGHELITCLNRVAKRLGGALHSEILNDLMQAIEEHKNSGSLEPHAVWVQKILKHYYDPMYQHQIDKRLLQVMNPKETGSTQKEKITHSL